MDYKFIILLLVIVGLILFFTREIDNMKCEMSDKLDKIASYVDNSSKNTLMKMQNGFGMCVTKLKNINGEYIEQVRKMNDYGNQPITNMSNNYTDTDSQGKGMKFAALSDCRMSKTSVKKQQGGESFYLSDDEPKKLNKAVSNEFQIVLPETEEKQHKFILSPDLIDDENNHITTESLSSKSGKKIIKNEISAEQHKNVKENKSNENEENNKEETNKYEENDEDNEENNDNVKEYSFNDIDENDVEESENDDISVEKSEHSSNYGSVTFGSKKQTKKVVSNENESVTSAVQKLNINTLLSKDMYTSEVLKKIAKELTIPIYHKDGSVRKQLKKDELYDKIKGHLTKISK